MALVFPSTGKNERMAAAVAVSALNPATAIVPAVWPIFQLILLVIYLHLSNRIKSFLKEEIYSV